MKLRVKQDDSAEGVDITSMIDVVFLLVIFFMVTSSFIEEAKVYKISLPRAEKPVTVSRDNTYMLSMTVDGGIYLMAGAKEEKVNNLEEVVKTLQGKKDTAGKLLPVVLRCDANCEYGVYVQAKNALRMAGVDTVFEEVEVRR